MKLKTVGVEDVMQMGRVPGTHFNVEGGAFTIYANSPSTASRSIGSFYFQNQAQIVTALERISLLLGDHRAQLTVVPYLSRGQDVPSIVAQADGVIRVVPAK